MSEEKEAIEFLKNYKFSEIDDAFLLKHITEYDEYIKTLINLIEKLKYKNKDLLRKLQNRVKEVKNLEKYSQYKKEFKTLNEQIKLKDKEIEELKNKNKCIDCLFKNKSLLR